MARIFTWPTKSIIEDEDLFPLGDDATGLDKSTSFANLVNSLQLKDWLINKSTTNAVLKWYKGNNGVGQKDIRFELTSTGLQLNLYDDTGAFISTVLEYNFSASAAWLKLVTDISKVGAIVVAYNYTTSDIAYGALVSGSSLYTQTSNSAGSGVSALLFYIYRESTYGTLSSNAVQLSGTWRNIGGWCSGKESDDYVPGIFQRVT